MRRTSGIDGLQDERTLFRHVLIKRMITLMKHRTFFFLKHRKQNGWNPGEPKPLYCKKKHLPVAKMMMQI